MTAVTKKFAIASAIGAFKFAIAAIAGYTIFTVSTVASFTNVTRTNSTWYAYAFHSGVP